MKKVSVIGHFAFGKVYLDGQTVKTHALYKELCAAYGEENVLAVDTHGIKKKILFLPSMIASALRKTENVIILPAHNGIRIIVPLLKALNALYKRKLHYSVIGGWLPSFLNGRGGLEKQLKTFDGIYVETRTMLKALADKGFKNVYNVPNFKRIETIPENELSRDFSEPYKFCIFSRIMRKKGIEDAIFAVKSVNERLGRQACQLDIYGPIDGAEEEWFSELEKGFPAFVSYKGAVDSYKSVSVLKDYFALLFPTRFFTEGVPGTIIDAYAAGIPVISSRWESFADVVDEGITGITYEFENADELSSLVLEVSKNPEKLISMKISCVKKAVEFTPEFALKELFARL